MRLNPCLQLKSLEEYTFFLKNEVFKKDRLRLNEIEIESLPTTYIIRGIHFFKRRLVAYKGGFVGPSVCPQNILKKF